MPPELMTVDGTVVAFRLAGGHLGFTLEDTDDFVLTSTKNEPVHLYSGQENVFQGISLRPIPIGDAK
jgi:hypothetical protein